MRFKLIRDTFRLQPVGGIMLIVAALAAIGIANSPLKADYFSLQAIPISLKIGAAGFELTFKSFVNDLMMSLFFLLVAMEIKREVLVGKISRAQAVVLPGIAAVGGMIVPPLFYLAFNAGNPDTQTGWAIPVATDIAFSLGVLSLLGKRVPVSLKLFLLSLAIVDDLGAIALITLMFSSDLSLSALGAGMLLMGFLLFLNQQHIQSLVVYWLTGTLLWYCFLQAGLQPTLAGVVLGFFIPLHIRDTRRFPLREMEVALRPWVAFLVLPLFGFINVGIDLGAMTLGDLFNPAPVGIALGLFLGKQLGVFSFAWLAIRLGFARLPDNINWMQLYGVALLCGIGFTMSIFVGELTFTDHHNHYSLGILAGSLIAATTGFVVLYRSLPARS